jgi:hypothetical protein
VGDTAVGLSKDLSSRAGGEFSLPGPGDSPGVVETSGIRPNFQKNLALTSRITGPNQVLENIPLLANFATEWATKIGAKNA